MTLSINQFADFFGALYQNKDHKPITPFPWQVRLARQVFKEGWPGCIDLPTASGKTAAIDIAVFVLACQANRPTSQRTVGRRIFFTVNRRVIVDEAYDRAKYLAEKLREATTGILKEVADVLRDISGDQKAPPLDVVQLRGGIYRDRAWARSITQPVIVCTTADQLGSRLLFRGYGVSPSMQPVHAALTGCDSLILLDEAHVTKAFSQTLGLLQRYRSLEAASPPMRFVEMTATPTSQSMKFELEEEDRSHPILQVRQQASKAAALVSTGKKPIVDEIAKRAADAVTDKCKAIGIIVNRVQSARDIYEKLREKFGPSVYLVIGRMRPIDRDVLQEKLKKLVGPQRPDFLDQPVFVVATQCLEVGADYDFDALFTECASIDALRQRFGRLNRKGRKNPDGTPIQTTAAIFTNDAALKETDPVYGDALKATWNWLNEGNRKSVDFGIAAFKTLWDDVSKDKRSEMLAPSVDAAVLLPAHLDVLCQTNPQPAPSPDVSLFIHGPRREMADVNVCWRADLGDDDRQWRDIVGLLPPTSTECMAVPIRSVTQWMRGQATKVDADIAVEISDEDMKDSSSKDQPEKAVLIWRGNESTVIRKPRDLRPGDTIIIPARDEDSRTLGHIPAEALMDVAEQAHKKMHRQLVIRLHPAIHPKLPEKLHKHAASPDSELSKDEIRDLLDPLFGTITGSFDEVDYPIINGKRLGLLLRFDPLPADDKSLQPANDEDDGQDAPSESAQRIPLDAHTRRVADRIRQAAQLLHLEQLLTTLEQAAMLHDIGKADVRFQALLAGLTPYEAMELPNLLAKSECRKRTLVERRMQRQRAQLPQGFRHEMLSVELIAAGLTPVDPEIDRDLLLHVIAAHHGYARPFAPVAIDNADDETRSVHLDGIALTCDQRSRLTPSHRLDSGIAERFWKLTRQHGWWGLAWLEAVIRLADQQASADELKGRA